KATLPGVPDFYQGTEFWDLSLVDPDNRRPVDFDTRAAVLKSLGSTDWSTLARSWANGHIKLAWTARLLQLRGQLTDVFTLGDSQPRGVVGPRRDRGAACAGRRGGDAWVVGVVRPFAAFREGGGVGPRGDELGGALDVRGFTLEGREAGAERLP